MTSKQHKLQASQLVLVVKNSPANAGDTREVDLILGLGRSPEGGHGNPLQYSCPENPMYRGAWQAKGHGVAKSQTRLKLFSTQAPQTPNSVRGRMLTHP